MDDFEPDVIFVGDLHLHERSEFPAPIGENPRLLDGLSILDQITELIKLHSIKYVIFTGDLFELKDNIPNHLLVPFATKIELMLVQGVEVISLQGNHDFKIPEYTTIGIFPSVKLKRTVDSDLLLGRTMTRTILYIPFRRKKEEFKDVWITCHKLDPHPDIILFHNELPGVRYSDKMRVPRDWDFPTFPGTLYIGGHIHKSQILTSNNNLVYFIGTPYPIDFDDVQKGATRNHILLYDIEQNRTKKYELDYPRFVELNLNDTKFVSVKGNYVRVVGTVQPQERSGIKEMKERLLNLGAKGVQLKVKYLTESVARIKTEKTDHHGVIRQFLDGSDTELDKDLLLTTGLEIMGKVK